MVSRQVWRIGASLATTAHGSLLRGCHWRKGLNGSLAGAMVSKKQKNSLRKKMKKVVDGYQCCVIMCPTRGKNSISQHYKHYEN